MADEPEAPITPESRDLATVAANAQGDAWLLHLLDLADQGFAVSVGLFLNGMVVMGALTTTDAMAKQIDAYRSRIAELSPNPPEGTASDEWQETLREFSRAAAGQFEIFEEERESREAAMKQYIADEGYQWDVAPAELSRRFIRETVRLFLTLRDVQITAPGVPGITRLEVLRVTISQISAWWLIQVDEHGKATIPLWSTE
jgi:hypothetical protein